MKPFIHYLITAPHIYTDQETEFEQCLQQAIDTHVIDFICFRDKISANIEPLAKICIQKAKQYNKKSIINGDIDLAVKLQANGVHLRSDQFDLISTALQKNLLVIISCHSLKQIQKAKQLGVHMATYSPIFTTPNKGKPKGIEHLNDVISKTSLPIIALGGIVSQKEVEAIKQTQAIGFASIRYFTN